MKIKSILIFDLLAANPRLIKIPDTLALEFLDREQIDMAAYMSNAEFTSVTPNSQGQTRAPIHRRFNNNKQSTDSNLTYTGFVLLNRRSCMHL